MDFINQTKTDDCSENGNGLAENGSLLADFHCLKSTKLDGESFGLSSCASVGDNNGLSIKSYKDLLPWKSDASNSNVFIQEMVELLKKHISESFDRESKVVKFKLPNELIKEVNPDLNDGPASLEELIQITRKTLEYSVKAGHPRFFNQLFAGLDITGLMAQWVTAATNTSMYTYEMAPVFLLMERSVLERFRELVGFTKCDGLLFPGGSLTNLQAMNIARYNHSPNIKEEGLYGLSRLTIFISEEAHYSSIKAASTLGLGTKSVIKVKTDQKGKMIPEDLHCKIKESFSKGETPFYVCATSGTTVAGAFDPLMEIADICAEFHLWLHVDAAWGGAVLLSKKHRHLMNGIEKADSVTWNPHKMMSVPLQCSILLVRHQEVLHSCNKVGATYLFQKDKKLYDVSWDSGDKTFQCGRHNDIFKLWLMWKAKGNIGFEEHVDKAFELSRYLANEVEKRENFQLLMQPECTNICFRYLPPSIAKMPDGPEKLQRLHELVASFQIALCWHVNV
eukprot:gene3132-3600_t